MDYEEEPMLEEFYGDPTRVKNFSLIRTASWKEQMAKEEEYDDEEEYFDELSDFDEEEIELAKLQS